MLRSHGLEPRHRILLAGPPGNGKTSLAEAIAESLSIPLLTVRYEAVIGSFLGETAGRLRRVFDYARTTPSVLFFDEFDVVGKERGDLHETGEIKRVVSSLLLQMDDLPSWTIIAAATKIMPNCLTVPPGVAFSLGWICQRRESGRSLRSSTASSLHVRFRATLVARRTNSLALCGGRAGRGRGFLHKYPPAFRFVAREGRPNEIVERELKVWRSRVTVNTGKKSVNRGGTTPPSDTGSQS